MIPAGGLPAPLAGTTIAMRQRVCPAERGFAVVEAAFWLAVTAGVLGVAAFVGLRGHADDNLTPEQQAYVRAVATQQALAYIQAVATQQAEAPPPVSAPPPAVAPPPARPAAPVAPAAPPPPPASAPPPAALPPAQSHPEPPAAAPTPAPRPPAPTTAPPPPPPPPPTATPIPPPPPPPPPPADLPPMAACVGFMNGNTSSGADACNQLVADPATNDNVAACISAVIAGAATSPDGKHDCTQAALDTRDAFLQDCFLGLAGLSHFGRRACQQYYERYANP